MNKKGDDGVSKTVSLPDPPPLRITFTGKKKSEGAVQTSGGGSAGGK